jgi:hypothetical protein
MADEKLTEVFASHPVTAPKAADLFYTVYNTDTTPQEGAIQYKNLSNGGWIPVSDTWTYASASTITIPSDGTTVYQKGMMIRLKQGGGYKYYNASAVAATLITVPINIDHVVANAGITDIAYSFSKLAYGFPTSFNFTSTPSYAGGTTDPTSNTIVTAQYNIINANTARVVIEAAIVKGTGNRTTFGYTCPFSFANYRPVSALDTITAASFKNPPASYIITGTMIVVETIANDGSIYINTLVTY